MSRFKEDISDAKERLKSWWDHEIIDRSVISYYYPREDSTTTGLINVFGFNWDLAKNPDDIEQVLTNFEEKLHELYFVLL